MGLSNVLNLPKKYWISMSGIGVLGIMHGMIFMVTMIEMIERV